MKAVLTINVVLVCGVALLCAGCESRAKREEAARQHVLETARSDLFMRLMQHKPIDKKTPLLAVKYGLPEQAVRDFVDAYAAEHLRDSLLGVFSLTNAAEVSALQARLDAPPAISNTIATISRKYGIETKTLGALLVDYYTWDAAEQRSATE